MKSMVCSKMWTSIDVQPDSKQVKTCCHRDSPSLSVEDLRRMGAKVFTSQPHDLADRNVFIDENRIPDLCRICKDAHPHSLWQTWNLWHNYDWSQQELEDLRTADIVNKFEIALTNKCNQTCMYCWPDRSNEWAKLLGVEQPEDEEWKAAFFDALFEYIRLHLSQRNTVVSYNLLGGEPLLNPQLYDFVGSIIDAHANDLFPDRLRIFEITTNLNVKSAGINQLIQVITRTQGWNWRIKCSIDAVSPAGEIIRDGLDVSRFSENLEMLLGHEQISVEILPSINVLSVPETAGLIRWVKDIMKRHNLMDQYGTRWRMGINMVANPEAMHPGNLTDDYTQCMDECLAEITDLPNCWNKDLIIKHLTNIRSLIGTKRGDQDQMIMRRWFDKQGQIKRKDYWVLFPMLENLCGPRPA
jgi:hypothetical protein